jgi:signal transduction histidine kinase
MVLTNALATLFVIIGKGVFIPEILIVSIGIAGIILIACFVAYILLYGPNSVRKLKKELSAMHLQVEGLGKEIKSRTENMERALEKAEESNRLKSLFLANMSHEIRTPLNGIVGFSELIADPDIDNGLKKEFSQHIIQNSEQLLKLIDQILHLSIIETGKVNISREEFRVKLLLLDLEKKFKTKIAQSKKEIKLILNIDHKNDKIYTDYRKLEFIIGNLFDNALKFTQSGAIFIDYYQQHDELVFRLADTGCGIAEDEYDIIFDPFVQGNETLKKIKGGSGLGLSNVKNYVILLGGKVWCENNRPQGLIVYFTLPALTAKGEVFARDFHTKHKTSI